MSFENDFKKLPSKLDLSIKDLDNVEREFHLLIQKLKAIEANEMPYSKEHFNQDLNGWINWINSKRL